ncbi:MAG TPA: alpha/beta fold hydrolase, partial [Roseiarcus sp.]|nr:alpha/beta fold hydrolase [Roseiarcus sp.]
MTLRLSMRRPQIKIMTLSIATCLLIYLAVVAAVALNQRKLMYFPQSGDVAPTDAGLPQAQVLELETADKETVVAWYIQPASGKPTILYFHGNGGGLELRNVRFQKLTRTGNGLLAVEYRGYGHSTGSPSEEGLLRDGEAGYARALALGVSPDRLVVMGESLGSGVAIALAARHPIGALVLDSPFSSAVDVAAAHYWFLPVRLLMLDQFRSNERIGAVHAALMVVHGAA